jgi:hypothetical protein
MQFVAFVTCVIALLINSQAYAFKNPENKMFQKWKKAVIHLECATDSQSHEDFIKSMNALRNKYKDGNIPKNELDPIFRKSRDIRSQGTAIFFQHEKRRYLITARHVLFNELEAKRRIEEEKTRSLSYPENTRSELLKSASERAINTVYNIIFRVPSLDEISGSQIKTQKFLMNLGAGVPWLAPYTFTNIELDLAIISLDQRDKGFADELISAGYEPITLSDISEEDYPEGTEVFVVGYPFSTSVLGELNIPPAMLNWSSKYVSLPVFAFGRISMIHNLLYFFWCDISIYPGNSGGPAIAYQGNNGGPVIGNEKLVGIVSQQPLIPVESLDRSAKTKLPFGSRIPFGKIIKAKYIKELLDIQIKKDIGHNR